MSTYSSVKGVHLASSNASLAATIPNSILVLILSTGEYTTIRNNVHCKSL